MSSESYQFASAIMKNATRGAAIDHKWDQAGPGGWQGVPANQSKYENETANANTKTINNNSLLICYDFFKNRRAQRLDV